MIVYKITQIPTCTCVSAVDDCISSRDYHDPITCSYFDDNVDIYIPRAVINIFSFTINYETA
jgi:hypothetical protein